MADNAFFRGLRGFAAGASGQGQQFLQQLNQDRKNALIQDALQVQGALQTGNVERAVGLLNNRAQLIGQLGGDPSDTNELLGKIQRGDIQGALTDAGTIVEFARQEGLIPQEPLATISAGSQVVNPVTGEVIASAPSDRVDTGSQVQSSEILSDGTTVQVLKNGTTQVIDAEGNPLSGEARRNAIKEAREFGAKFQGQRARQRALGTEIAKTSVEQGADAFKRIAPIQKNIRNLDRVIGAIDKGAKTGAVERFLPSIRTASIELDNLRNQLGLDVVGNVTFGALSEGELSLALDTALPTGLNETELRQWAVDKKAAQQAVATELRRAAKFFSMGGTITDFLNLQDRAQPAPAGGQVLRFDAQGNQI